MAFPKDLSNLRRLRRVDLSCRHIPQELATLPALEWFGIRGCKSLPANVDVLYSQLLFSLFHRSDSNDV